MSAAARDGAGGDTPGPPSAPPAGAEAARPLTFLTGFESTYQPGADRDVFEATGHDARRASDLALVRECGVTMLRYPVRWHRVEQREGERDWTETDRVLGELRDEGFRVVLDLVHHTSYPRWLRTGFADPRFGTAYLRYVEEVARRYPWIEAYTLFNEPFATLFLAGHQGVWPPHLHGVRGFVRLCENVLPALAVASRMYAQLLPDARHVYVDTCERHTADAGVPSAERYATMADDRRFFLLDVLLGRPVERDRPFVADVLAAGGRSLLDLEPGHVDVLGLDFYAHSQWHYRAGRGVTPSPVAEPLSVLLAEYASRYGLPCMLTETNIRGFASDRASWLKYTLEQCELARAAGVPLEGYCWFPFVDSCDWDTLLRRAEGHIDPVGVCWLDERGSRHRSSMSAAFATAAAGAPSSVLPAYRFQPPLDRQLRGYLPHMAHWSWVDPPPHEIVAPDAGVRAKRLGARLRRTAPGAR